MSEWEAFYQLEPWGTPAEDDRWRIHYMLTFRSAFQGVEPDWLDRDPEETARRRAEESAAISLEDKIETFFSSRVVTTEDAEPSK